MAYFTLTLLDWTFALLFRFFVLTLFPLLWSRAYLECTRALLCNSSSDHLSHPQLISPFFFISTCLAYSTSIFNHQTFALLISFLVKFVEVDSTRA